MKRFSRAVAVCSGCVLGLLPVAGCQPVRFPATVALDPSIGLLVVQAGVPSTKSGLVTFNNTSGITIGSGALSLNASAITVTAAGPGKFLAFQATTTTLTITARIAPPSERETVCETGETYGPFTVALAPGFVPVSVEPANFTITQSTIDLLNAGGFSLCLEVVSPIDGTVTIQSMAFDLGL